MSSAVRQALLAVTPLALAVVLFWHPAGGEDVYEGIRGDVGAWLVVHAAFLLATPLLGIGAFLLLKGLPGRAATVSRVALVCFLVFYTAYESNVGIGTAVLADYANGLAPAEQTAVAGAIQEYNRHWLISDPSVSLLAGGLGWIVAMLAAAVAFRRAGAAWPLTVLVGLAALFAIHPPPIGPVGLVCFAAACVLVERARAREAAVPAAPALTTPSA
jgi:hypothetical protein